MRPLRQGTSAVIKLGPLVSPADALTPYTTAGFAVKVAANGGALAARHDPTAIAHDADGYFNVSLDATDTATIGRLRVELPGSAGNYLPAWEDFTVLAAAVYDVLFGTTAPSTLTAAAAAAAVANQFGQPGTVSAATSGGSFSASVAASGLSSVNSFYVNAYLKFNDLTSNDSIARRVTGYTVSGDTATFTFTDPFPSTPGVGDSFLIVGHA